MGLEGLDPYSRTQLNPFLYNEAVTESLIAVLRKLEGTVILTVEELYDAHNYSVKRIPHPTRPDCYVLSIEEQDRENS